MTYVATRSGYNVLTSLILIVQEARGMKAAGHEMHKSMLGLKHLMQERRGAQEHIEVEAQAAREQTRHKTRETREHGKKHGKRQKTCKA